MLHIMVFDPCRVNPSLLIPGLESHNVLLANEPGLAGARGFSEGCPWRWIRWCSFGKDYQNP